MAETTLEMAKKGIALYQRDRERRSEPKAKELKHVTRLVMEGRLDDKYWSWAYEPTNKSEHMKLPPQFKAINQDLDMLNRIVGMDKSKLKALEEQAAEFQYIANELNISDTSKPIDYQGKRYYYPGRELDEEKKSLAKFEREAERIITSLNQVAKSEPQVLDDASKRLKTIRQVLKVPQSYEEVKQGLPPIEKPAVDFINDLRNGEQDTRFRARKVLADAGIDGDAINKESDTFDSRTGRPFLSETDKMVMEAREAQDKQGGAVSTESQNKGTQNSGQ
jgi:hypothetical protein